MSGTIFIDDERAWPVSGWLYRWVITDVKQATQASLSPEGRDELDMALAVKTLDLRDLTAGDRAAVHAALGDEQIQRFEVGLEPGFDPASSVEALRELAALAGGSA